LQAQGNGIPPKQPKERKKLGKRKYFEQIRGQLENERSTFIAHWRELGDYILPRRPRFFVQDANKGDRRNNKIIDSTATLAARTLRSGMMAGVTSPARPWFKITTGDPDLAEYGPVREWLRIVEQRMSTVFLRSNLYNALPLLYGDMGVFATSAMFVEEDFENVMRFHVFPIGSYMIALDSSLRVRIFFREFQMTVRQVVEKYAKTDMSGNYVWDNISDTVRDLWLNGNDEAWISICHIIMPNSGYDPGKLGSQFKKYLSCTYEKGTSSSDGSNYMWDATDDDKMLKESGYDYFPVLCPRWGVTGEDVYGTDCPGMDSIGDVKSLQLMHKRKAQAIAKSVNPPMKGPAILRNSKTSIIAGDITYVDEREGQKGFSPIHEVDPRIQEMLLDIQDHQDRVRRAFFEDLFLMLAHSDRREITAREIEERHEEKLLALGPVLEQLNQDLLDPLIDIAFDIMNRQGLIPDAPYELEDQKLKVEYVSAMAQAQKLIGLASIERTAAFVGKIVTETQDPSNGDKLDIDQTIDEYAAAAGSPSNIIRTDEKVQEIRQRRAESLDAKKREESIMAAGKAAKDLSQSDLGGGENALSMLVKSAKAGEPAPQQ
jgi:hypothetical protein